MQLSLKHILLFSLLAFVSACAREGQTTDRGSPPAKLAPLTTPTHAEETFVASEPPITSQQWQKVFDEVKAMPGARVDVEGPMLVVILVASSEENAVYMFTQPAHPAHPAYLKAFSNSASGRPTIVVGDYAGSKTEFENWVRTVVALLRKGEE